MAVCRPVRLSFSKAWRIFCRPPTIIRPIGIPILSTRVSVFWSGLVTVRDCGMDPKHFVAPSGSSDVQPGDVVASCESRDSEEESHVSDAKLQDSDDESHDRSRESCSVEGKSGDSVDERYSYMQRGFTSEIFKIEINNIPPHVGYQQIKKHLKGLKLNPVKIKKPHKSFCYVTFRSDEDRQAALQTLNGLVWKKKTLTAVEAAPALDPLFMRKRRRTASETELDAEIEAKRQCTENLEELPLEERLAAAVTPLMKKPYEEQLEEKQAGFEDFLKRAAVQIRKKESHPGEWFRRHVEQHGGAMCRLEPIRASPIQTEYRNKCEFSIGISADNRPVVGFRLASYKEGDFTVVSPDACIHIPQKMKEIVKGFQEYFGQSALQPYDHVTGNGHWWQVMVRCYGTGESLAVVQLHPQELSQDELAAEKAKLSEYFASAEGSQYQPTSLYIQCTHRTIRTPGAGEKLADFEHLLGEKHVHESLLGMRFRISPSAFFQVNTVASEVLYSLVRELSSTGTPSIVYDICCGTGTIGLYLAKALGVSRVVGVEMVEQAIADARVNAQLNGVTNAEFLCGKAEDVLPKHLERVRAARGQIIGVVDPPRGGLHPRVVQVIRKCLAIDRLVYVSCNPAGALNNFTDLCRRESNRIRGTPFRPVSATPVDLFPHTKHCELVVLFERVKPTGEEIGSGADTREESRSETGFEMPLSNFDESEVPGRRESDTAEEKHDSSSDRKAVGEFVAEVGAGSVEIGPISGSDPNSRLSSSEKPRKNPDAQNSSGGKLPEDVQ